MQCPNCAHSSESDSFQCAACGEVYDLAALEKLHNLEFLVAWLEAHDGARVAEAVSQREAARMALRPPVIVAPVAAPTETQLRELALAVALGNQLETWLAAVAMEPADAQELHAHVATRIAGLRAAVPTAGLKLPAVPEADVIGYALDNLPRPALQALRPHFESRLTSASAPAPIMPPIAEPATQLQPAHAPAPSRPSALKPAKPAKPPINWGQVWERAWNLVVSGALLRGLLYLGAFMIVASAIVLVVVYWSVFPWPVRLALIAAVPLAFYAGGFFLRNQLKIPVAGGVFTGIGALLVAVDFAAVYQIGGLAGSVDVNGYWLVASLVCTAVYLFTIWRVPGEFFAYLTLLGGLSTVLALASVARLPLEWRVATVAASGALIAAGAARFRHITGRWAEMSLAAKRLPLMLFPATGLLALTLQIYVAGNQAFGQSATFWLMALGYGTLAVVFSANVWAHAAVWSSVGGVGFALAVFNLPSAWYATAAAVVAPLYLSGGLLLEMRQAQRGFVRAVDVAALGLMLAASAGGLATLAWDWWAGVWALALAALVWGAGAWRWRQPLLVLLGGGLFIVPFSLGIGRALYEARVWQWGAWLMAAWAWLSSIYLTFAVLSRRAERYGLWLAALAHGLVLLSFFGLFINYSFTFRQWSNGPTLIALGGALVMYLASALLHDSNKHPALSRWVNWLGPRLSRATFLWPIGALLPVMASIGWWGSVLQPEWLGAALAGLALAYVGAGQLLQRRAKEYRWPPHVLAYALLVIGIAFAQQARWPLMVTLYVAVASLAALAFAHRRAVEVGLAALLLLWPFYLSLLAVPLAPMTHTLAFALLAAFGYIPLGLLLQKAKGLYHWPLYAVGYAVSVLAVAASLLNSLTLGNIQWIAVAVPLIATGLYVFSLYRFKWPPFAWAMVVVFSLAFWQTLALLRVLAVAYALMWVGLALAYMLMERTAARTPATHWTQRARWPLGVGALVLSAGGLWLTASQTMSAIAGYWIADDIWILAAQTLAVGLATLAARLYRRRWPLLVGAPLSFVPFTLAFIGYTSLRSVEFAWVWLGWATVLLGLGLVLDRSAVRYSHGPYLTGYALAAFALAWSVTDRVVNLYTLGGVVLLALASHIVVHAGRHRAFDDLCAFVWKDKSTVAARAGRTIFLFVAVYGFPVWLMQLLAHFQVALAWRGLALALVAPLYIAFGLAVRRVRSEYTWPLYSAGYALTALGAMLAFENQTLAIYVLALDAVVYAASAYIFRQAFWLYLSNILAPIVVLLTLHRTGYLNSTWVAGVFMTLAFIYYGAGQWFNRRKESPTAISAYALPFYAPGYVLSAVALAASSADKFLALAIFPAGVGLYALSAWTLREALFLYPAVWLTAVPYYLLLTLTPLPAQWYGLAWLPLIVSAIGAGRFGFHRRAWGVQHWRSALTQPAMPFYLMAYALSVSMMVLSQASPWPLTLAFGAGALVYFSSAALFKRASWLYPALLALHLTVMAALTIHPTDAPPRYATLPFLGLTWVIALVGYAFARASRASTFLTALRKPSWAQPLLLFAALDVFVWQALALYGYDTGVTLASGFALLLTLLATLWPDAVLAHVALGFGVLAGGVGLRWAGFAVPKLMAVLSGAGFGLYLISRVTERVKFLAVWPLPLTRAAVALTGLAVIITLPSTPEHLTATAGALAFAGLLYLTLALRGRWYYLGYGAVALLQFAWALLLIRNQIAEPQWYAIPVGVYLTGMGFLERRRGARPLFAQGLESLGLAVLLLTTFIQSLRPGAAGTPYFVLLIVEGLLVVGWGAWRRIKVPFFIGFAASALNVVGQVVVLFAGGSTFTRWLVIGVAGLLIVALAVFVERQRTLIIAKAKEWREALETWH